MVDLLIMYGISILLIVCGFAALLLQKIYVSDDDGTQTEVDLPFFGKLKTNYPALVFVLLGVAGAFYTFDNRAREWWIRGTLELLDDPELANLKDTGFRWNDGNFTTFPSRFTPQIDETGTFSIRVVVSGAGSLEDVAKELMYEHPRFKGEIILGPNTVKSQAEREVQLYPMTVEYFPE